MAVKKYTVRKGDTLAKIAKDNNTTVAKLVELNDIANPNRIVVGQVLIISDDSGSTPTKAKNNSNKANINVFGLQSDTDRTVYAAWVWSKSNTDSYKVKWYYDTGDGVWFVGDDSTTTNKQSIYNAPQNANRVRFKVKPIAKKHKVNGKETAYWTAEWSSYKTYSFSDNPPNVPPVPKVKIENLKLTAWMEGLDTLAEGDIEFYVVKNNTSKFATGKAAIKKAYASYAFDVTAGNEYKVCARWWKNNEHSDWSAYSDNVGTPPAATKGIKSIKALSETEVQIDWVDVANAKSYVIEYTTKKRYFDSNSSEVRSVTVDATVAGHCEITGLETGEEYFFRIRAVNDNGNSPWSEIVSIIVGKKPSAPTTWSSATTLITGEPLILYWIHNSEDGSSQTYADLELYINGVMESHTIKNTTVEEEKDKTSSYKIDTSSYVEGTKIEWRVRTAGITNQYGDWSIQRTVDIYAPPTLELSVTDVNGNELATLTSFPFYVKGVTGPSTQTPIGYYVNVISNESYETVDQVGNIKMVNSGESVYSNFFDTDEQLLLELSAHNIDLENNVEYTVKCTSSMNSGLTAEASSIFLVAWEEIEYSPNAEISIDYDSVSASIHPYCEDVDGNLVEGVSLAVYRREYDGRFVEIASGIDNMANTYITDPHPSLDYARYRIVAITESTGSVGYYDMPGYPVGVKGIIIQWDENWSNFDVTNEDVLEEPIWSGSLLRLPYNVDVSDSNRPDVALVSYIGRSHPVSYYGTQLGQSSTWSTEIPRKDKETLYALRRLSIWMGDVYIRESSGSGYWANITVSFNQKHCELTIPVTLDITRVEGGV